MKLTFKEYYNTEDKYEIDFHIRYFEDAKDIFKVGSLRKKAFGVVKDLQYYFEKGLTFEQLFEVIEKLTKIKIDTLANFQLFELMKFKNYLKSEIDKINFVEKETLTSIPLAIDIEAGIDRYEPIASYLQFSELAGGDITKIDSIYNQEYDLGYLELLKRKIDSDFIKEKSRIMNLKNK